MDREEPKIIDLALSMPVNSGTRYLGRIRCVTYYFEMLTDTQEMLSRQLDI